MIVGNILNNPKINFGIVFFLNIANKYIKSNKNCKESNFKTN